MSDRDRRDATHSRTPDRYCFADEEPERRAGKKNDPDAHVHETDGYCDHGQCKGWVPADK